MNIRESADLNRQMQLSSATAYNRYPELFRAVAEITAAKRDGRPRVLSFGCSTGEEIKSLDLIYTEGCDLIGVDIDPNVIERAGQLVKGTRNVVEFHTSSVFNSEQRFDVVLALSVLCRWPDARGRANITPVYSFEEFSTEVHSIAELVSDGGYLCLTNTNFYFEDTPAALSAFTPVFVYDGCEGYVERFDVNGNHYVNKRPGACVFQKTIKWTSASTQNT